jgi:radical SAM superfamily enzyme YgiQ (UPF0313 family)
MANILLSHSYFLRYDDKAWRQMKPYPPLGTLYVASALRDAGHEVQFFDAMLAESEKDIIPYLDRVQPDVVLFYEDNFNFLSKMCLTRMREACFSMAAYAKERGFSVVAQGSDPVDHLTEYFRNNVDVVICGEGEGTAVELVEAMQNNTGLLKDPLRDEVLSAIHGIAFPGTDSANVTQKRRLINDLDSISFPAWDLVDMEQYRSIWLRHHGYFSLNLVSTRGCPFHCNWCAKPVYGQVYNSRSAENVAQELAHLKDKYSVDHIWFADDILGLKPGWLKTFSDEVERLGVTTPFNCQTRADLLLNEDNVKNMARAGADTVWIGAESGSQKILDAMDKGTQVEQILECTKLMKAEGIKVAWFLQFGYLGETGDDIDLTLQMLKNERPSDIGISVSYPLPGTPFYEKVKSLMTEKQNWTDSGDLDLMYTGSYPPAFYRALHSYVHGDFRMKQGLRDLLRLNVKGNLRRIALLPWYFIMSLSSRSRMMYHKRPLLSRSSKIIAGS